MKQVLIVDDSASIRRRLIALLAESPRIRIAGGRGQPAGLGHHDACATRHRHCGHSHAR